ncbi:peptide deformylase [Candidatus Terasakiella magnetica]|uniref:Peptide deformylase n=1 Tax=Candidatus Terasakiella magnetica TaxID=1867952 RepID=A0A1C3RED0_9PROT|nr:peptide deformylase [Candidatus Terasakiella magnetica]SCA55643.1 peptide deformylase [Candidatus Terasakiella magnetica]
MAILEILTAPDPVLKKKAAPVVDVNDSIRALLDDMLETMYDAPGIGLAAPQVGILQQVIVIDVSEDDEGAKPVKMINPEITWASEELASYEEGCLSVPKSFGDVERPEKVKVKYLDENGAPQEMEAYGLLATCIQHEIDHLNGKLFIDHISRLKRAIIIKKLTKLKKTG